MAMGLIYGTLGLVAGAGFGVLGVRLGRARAVQSGGPDVFDERFHQLRPRAGLISWLLTLCAMIVMWGLIQSHVIDSAALAVGLLYLFSVLAFAGASATLNRNH